ncbi:type VI secretion system contractile sheath small subunit [Betaproteobacteria bacterium]|nr:type VI secretion system contractile sheath small subunit [Betaproteobacteria bacterium]
MADSLQKWVGRNRPPRVQITYDVEIGDAIEKKELPFVVGLLADLSGDQDLQPKLRDRRFVEIDRDNFNEVMAKISPKLGVKIPDVLKGDGELNIDLEFRKFDDFHPESLVKQVPRLEKLLLARQYLRDLVAKLDGNDELNTVLSEIAASKDEVKKLKTEALPETDNSSGENETGSKKSSDAGKK